MANKVIWTQKAVVQIENILTFLSEDVSDQSASKFLELIMSKVKSLENNTYEGRIVPKMRTVRFILVGKHHRLYYRRNGLTLVVTQIYDTRQSVDKKPYRK